MTCWQTDNDGAQWIDINIKKIEVWPVTEFDGVIRWWAKATSANGKNLVTLASLESETRAKDAITRWVDWYLRYKMEGD
jgi:hypothetical protein